ncbi:MAG TPA: hypothetical protein DCM87_05115 [Planctomycetes bacterium]|nr:hypothetical protein [Planctomycetota bacterium]
MIPREEELVFRSRWLVRVRWIVAGVMALGALAAHAIGLTYPPWPLLGIAIAVAAYNVLFALAAPRLLAPPVDLRRVHGYVNTQIGADFFALLVWIHFTGGPLSPFLAFFVFHLVICGLLVGRRTTVIHAFWVLASLIVMGVAESQGWLRHHPPIDEGAARPIDATLHLLTVGSVTGVTLITVAVLVGGIANRLRHRERELDEARAQLERHAAEIEGAHAQLEKLDEERNAFFRLVSHQLRAPLTSIQTVLRLVTSGYAEEPEKVTELVGRADRQAQHMLALINDMLSLTRIRVSCGDEVRESVALGPLLDDVVEGLQNVAQERCITLSSRLPPALPAIPAVRRKAEQLFTVLVENALKYTPAGGEVEVTAAADGDAARIAVRDTGIGIPPDAVDKIFGEFYRAPNAKAHVAVGTGLGLAIAERIVRELNGAISVRSAVSQGSTFTVTIPLPRTREAEES